jgi:hypothetical protein
LEEAKRRLGTQKVTAALEISSDFGKLYEVVERAIGNMDYIGDLTVYDITQRLAAFLGYEPTCVYLHAGTEDGARALGLSGKTVEIDQLPIEFQRLTPAEVEDVLCREKDHLRRIRDTSR